MNIDCINNKIANANGALQPIILNAIKEIYLMGNHEMTARMVKDHLMNFNAIILWNNRIPAICNAIRNAIECGGNISGEDGNFNDFTIAFNGNANINSNTIIPEKTKVESKKKDKQNYSSKPHYNNEKEKLNLSENFKIVMICAGGKNDSFFTDYPKENFVNNPLNNFEHHPDEKMNDGIQSWREHLTDNQNDQNLLKAYDLYLRNEYQRLFWKYKNDFYILSAGWGLVNSEFRLPKYDITFSNGANVPPNTRRDNNLINHPPYNDFNQLNANDKEDIIFIGSPDYIPLFIRLTEHLKNRKIIYWKSRTPITVPDRFPIPNNTFLYRFYNTTTNTNWYYEVANDFCDDIIP